MKRTILFAITVLTIVMASTPAKADHTNLGPTGEIVRGTTGDIEQELHQWADDLEGNDNQCIVTWYFGCLLYSNPNCPQGDDTPPCIAPVLRAAGDAVGDNGRTLGNRIDGISVGCALGPGGNGGSAIAHCHIPCTHALNDPIIEPCDPDA